MTAFKKLLSLQLLAAGAVDREKLKTCLIPRPLINFCLNARVLNRNKMSMDPTYKHVKTIEEQFRLKANVQLLICGGYAVYQLGDTTEYGDVDMFGVVGENEIDHENFQGTLREAARSVEEMTMFSLRKQTTFGLYGTGNFMVMRFIPDGDTDARNIDVVFQIVKEKELNEITCLMSLSKTIVRRFDIDLVKSVGLPLADGGIVFFRLGRKNLTRRGLLYSTAMGLKTFLYQRVPKGAGNNRTGRDETRWYEELNYGTASDIEDAIAFWDSKRKLDMDLGSVIGATNVRLTKYCMRMKRSGGNFDRMCIGKRNNMLDFVEATIATICAKDELGNQKIVSEKFDQRARSRVSKFWQQ